MARPSAPSRPGPPPPPPARQQGSSLGNDWEAQFDFPDESTFPPPMEPYRGSRTYVKYITSKLMSRYSFGSYNSTIIHLFREHFQCRRRWFVITKHFNKAAGLKSAFDDDDAAAAVAHFIFSSTYSFGTFFCLPNILYYSCL